MLTKKEPSKNDIKNSKPQPPQSQNNLQKAKNPSTSQEFQQQNSHFMPQSEKRANQKTRITIKYDVGFSNQLSIRGKGANLTWEKGQPLKNIKADEWIWETDTPFTNCEFKVLVNDRVYETGDNHFVTQGAHILYTPHFPKY